MLNAKLVVVGGEVKTTEIKLRLPCVIGRGKGSTVILPHPLVSRQHCELFESSGRLWVRDLGSLNGTYVNNDKITEKELPPNELLTVGAVTFRAVYDPLPGTSPPEGLPPPQPRTAAVPPDDEQPTVRVDVPERVEDVAGFEEVPIEEIAVEVVEEDAAGVPSAPLFESPSPAVTQRPPSPGPARPAAQQRPAAAPAAVAPKTSPAAPQPEAEEEDDDLRDFLKGLENKK